MFKKLSYLWLLLTLVVAARAGRSPTVTSEKQELLFKEGEVLQFVPYGIVTVESSSDKVEGREGRFAKVKREVDGVRLMTVFVPESEWNKTLRRPLPLAKIESFHAFLLAPLSKKKFLVGKNTPSEQFLKLQKSGADFEEYVQLLREAYEIPREQRPLQIQKTIMNLEEFILSEMAFVKKVPLNDLHKVFVEKYKVVPR